jgi:hypothetical protein
MADADADPNYTAIKLRLSQVDLTVFRWLDMSEVRVGQMWEQVSKHERGIAWRWFARPASVGCFVQSAVLRARSAAYLRASGR